MRNSMKRAMTVVGAVLGIGLSGSVAFAASDNGAVAARPGVTVDSSYVGGLPLDDWCQRTGHARSGIVRWDVYGWVCVDHDGRQSGIDLNAACRTYWGSDTYAAYTNYYDPYSWGCYRD